MTRFASCGAHWSLLLLLVGVLGCSNDLATSLPPSIAPSSLQVSAAPPRPMATGFAMDLSWSARRADENVTYEWAVGFSRGSTNYIADEDLIWTRTQETGLTLTFDEDSSAQWVGVDPRSRTFYVRIAASGESAPSKVAELSFTPRSLAPEVHFFVSAPAASDSCIQSTRRVVVKWEASDPDSKGLVPEAVRYVLLPRGGPTSPCLTKVEYEAENPIASLSTEDPRWSDWIPYDKHGDFHGAPGGVDLGEFPMDTPYLVAVQARDKDGATSRDFTWSRSAVHFRTSDTQLPVLRIVDKNSYAFEEYTSIGKSTSIDVVSGQTLQFFWTASADHYYGVISAYRYGWDVLDPADSRDPGWIVPWGDALGNRQSQSVSFSSGTHTLIVQASDNSGAVSQGQLEIVVHQIPTARRPLLLVDDWRSIGDEGASHEVAYDAKWESVLRTLLPGFDSIGDVIDVQDAASDLTLDRVLQYDAVLWFTAASTQSYMHRFSQPRLTSEGWNWLEVYQGFGGNLLIAGPLAMKGLIPDDLYHSYPIPLDDPASGVLGLGTFVNSEGLVQNVGTTTWAYRGFCLEAIDLVRPPFASVYGEAAYKPLRFPICDAIHSATVDASFLATAPGAGGLLRDLIPTQARLDLRPLAKLRFEEFYNTNVTSRRLSLTDRDCYTAMFRARTRRGAGMIADPERDCSPESPTQSPLEGVTIGIMSGSYSSTKPQVGSHDFLWGFNPMEFEEDGLARALYWVFAHDWGLIHVFPKGW
jgi:hypothetical protein